MIALDTHALVWWAQQPELLSAAAEKALTKAERILLPAICFWEVALLVRRGRLALKRRQPVAEWAAEVLAIPRVFPVPLTVDIALSAESLEMHPDPADRFIAATAISQRAALVTKDDLLRGLAWLKTVW